MTPWWNVEKLDSNFVGDSHFICYSYQDGIVNSEIRVVAPSLTLRNILETTNNFTLKNLMLFLEAHHLKGMPPTYVASAYLYSNCQRWQYILLRWDALSYVIIVLLALLKSGVKYDNALVLKLFFKALEKGITSSYILSEIKEL